MRLFSSGHEGELRLPPAVFSDVTMVHFKWSQSPQATSEDRRFKNADLRI